jgi:hypothetical protein
MAGLASEVLGSWVDYLFQANSREDTERSG